MTNKERQASDEALQKFNISQNEKCISVKKEKLNELMNKISMALKDATLAQGFEIICQRLRDYENNEVVFKGDMEETIAQNLELKKEITELKKSVEYWKNEYFYLKSNPEEA